MPCGRERVSQMKGDPLEFGPVTPEEIAAFARRLAEWGETLSPKERVLAQLLVERTRDIEPKSVLRAELKLGVGDAAREVIESINQRWNADGDVWLEFGPLWLRSNEIDRGEEVEITQRLYAREQQ